MQKNLKNIKIIFMGTPDFSVPIFNALINYTDIIAVVTQPDKTVGRKHLLNQSPVKQLALENKIKVLQPNKIKDNQQFLNIIKELNPDLIVVAAYGFILPQALLVVPKYGVINVHSSLLPKYRGSSPIQAAILNGDKITGVTIMKINKKMDEGAIISQAAADIDDDETFQTLHDKLSVLGADLLIDTLSEFVSKKIKPQKQNDKKATYCNLITKDDGQIDWAKSASEIERQVRAFNPWPGSWTIWGDKKLKIHKVEKLDSGNCKFGEAFKSENGLAIQCGEKALLIKKIQIEGKKIMMAKEFLNGYSSIIGSVLS